MKPDYLSNVLDDKKIATLKKKSVNINKINLKDIILIASKLDNAYSIIGLTMVDDLYNDDSKLFGYYASIRKINLKSIKYFKNPIIFNNVKDKLSINALVKKEIIEIPKDDLEKILDFEQLVSQKPLYLSDIKVNYADFLINIIKITYDILNMDKHLKQMNINEFIKIIQNNLKNFNVKISHDEIVNYYSKNIWKLNYRHVPSRNPKKNILLYDALGKSRSYGYIIFDHKE